MTYFSTQVHHTPAELALSALTAGAFLVTPDILKGLTGPPLVRRIDVWLRAFRMTGALLAGLGTIGIALVIIGASLGLTANTGRVEYLAGVGLIVIVLLLGLVPVWAVKSTKDAANILSPEFRKKLAEWFAKVEREGWPLLLGAVLIVVGSGLQFIANTQG
jgi:hypothetical protein